MPAVKSRNWLPSTSVAQQPSPWSITKGYARVKLGDIAFASRAISSAALGPGRAVAMLGRRPVITPEKISVMPQLTPEQVRFLNAPNVATVATVMPDGSPEATVVWIESDADHVYFNTAMHRLKARNLQRDPRVAVTAFDAADPYTGVAVRGRAELILEGALEHIERISRLYTGEPFRALGPDEVRVIVKITPERIHVFE